MAAAATDRPGRVYAYLPVCVCQGDDNSNLLADSKLLLNKSTQQQARQLVWATVAIVARLHRRPRHSSVCIYAKIRDAPSDAELGSNLLNPQEAAPLA